MSVSSVLLWRVAVVAALIDLPILFLLARRVSSALFSSLKWYLAGSAFIVYAALWGAYGSMMYWEAVYSQIFPSWSRWLLAPGYGLLFGLLALLFWWLCRRIARGQVLWFILCGALMSLVGHTIGISRGLMRVPMLAQASIASALVFGIFEFTFYFCAIVLLSVAGRWLILRLRAPHGG